MRIVLSIGSMVGFGEVLLVFELVESCDVTFRSYISNFVYEDDEEEYANEDVEDDAEVDENGHFIANGE